MRVAFVCMFALAWRFFSSRLAIFFVAAVSTFLRCKSENRQKEIIGDLPVPVLPKIKAQQHQHVRNPLLCIWCNATAQKRWVDLFLLAHLRFLTMHDNAWHAPARTSLVIALFIL